MINKQKEKIINIVFFSYIIIMYIVGFQKVEFCKNIIENFWILIFNIIDITMENITIIALYGGYKIYRRIEYKKQLSKIDLKNDGSYYREILENYSPFLLSFIDNFIFDSKKDIIATLLNLKMKKIIEIENNKIKILSNDKSNLEESEKYILEHVYNGKIKIENISELQEKILRDAENKKLINIKNKKPKLKTKHLIIMLLIVVVINIITIITMENSINNHNFTLAMISAIIYLMEDILYIPIIILLCRKAKKIEKIKIRRTKLGEEINIKIEGLKNYIKDYSNLDQKETQEIAIWEDYLIYSIIFDINKKTIKEMKGIFYKEWKEENIE